MKKWTVIVCALALVASAGVASAAGMYGGFKGGINMASLSGDSVDDLDTRNGFAGGLFWGTSIAQQFDVRIEGLYVSKGAEGPSGVTGDGHAHDTVFKLDYIEIPVLFVANFGSGEKLGFNVFGGPTFAFNIKDEAEVEDHDETVDLEAKGFEFGAAIGAGLEYMMSSFALTFDARYSLGASNISDTEGVDVKNRGIGLMAGLKFPLGAK